MRKAKAIIEDGTRVDIKTLEVLLDIRDLLVKQVKKNKTKKSN